MIVKCVYVYVTTNACVWVKKHVSNVVLNLYSSLHKKCANFRDTFENARNTLWHTTHKAKSVNLKPANQTHLHKIKIALFENDANL